MGLLQHYAQLEQQAKELHEKMKLIQAKDEFKKELEFSDKLRELMQEFDKSSADVITLLSPEEVTFDAAAPRRKKRKLKLYQNPNTDEIVKTRGGNHKILKAWKEEYGAEVVESWIVEER